jgi:hypothetical protein
MFYNRIIALLHRFVIGVFLILGETHKYLGEEGIVSPT